MGRTWEPGELTVNKDGHKWIFSGAKQWDKGHVSVEFYCANNGCPTTMSLCSDPYEFDKNGLCASPINQLECAKQQMKKEMKTEYFKRESE